MTPGAIRQAVIDMWGQILQRPHVPADQLLNSYVRGRRYMGSKDRQNIARIIYRMLNHRLMLEWLLTKEKIQVTPASMMLLDAVMHDRLTYEGMDAWADRRHGLKEPVDRSFIQRLTGLLKTQASAPQHIVANCPQDIWQLFVQAYGADAPQLLAAALDEAPTTLRVNTLKATREQVIASLRLQEIVAVATEFSPYGLQLDKRRPLGTTQAFNKGWLEVQDEGSQLISLWADAKPGMRVVDFCAGAGGKSLAMAMMMQNRGHIALLDNDAPRLERAKLRIRRAGVSNHQLVPIKDHHDAWVKKHANSFDLVFVDAPCSGTGTWRRNPDARWRHSAADIDELAALQLDILLSAARLLKVGGRLIYATCSLLPQENQHVVEKFLTQRPQFSRAPWTQTIDTRFLTSEHDVQLRPDKFSCDGFYAAHLQLQGDKA